LHYFPKIAVVLNVEFDHPDCYENLAAVKQAFTDFSAQAKIVVKDINQLKNDLNLQLKLPGEHYLRDALAAQAVGRILGIDDKVIKASLESYQGTARRFELKGEVQGVTVIDDYAHHPTEIKATLKAAREKYPDQSLPVYTTLGVKPIIKYLNGEIDLPGLEQAWVTNELNYAKRQMTWFKKQPDIVWYDNL